MVLLLLDALIYGVGAVITVVFGVSLLAHVPIILIGGVFRGADELATWLERRYYECKRCGAIKPA